MKSRREPLSGPSSSKSKLYEDNYSSKEMQSRKTALEHADNKQMSEIADRLHNTKVKDTRGPVNPKRSGRRNTPVPTPMGKGTHRHTGTAHGTARGKAPRPPDIIEGKSILDKASTTAKREPRPARARAFSDSSWRDVDLIRGSNRDGHLIKKTGMKSVLPPMTNVTAFGRRTLPGPGERLRPLSIPTTDIGSNKMFTSRQSVGDKLQDSKTRTQKGKGVVRRSRTLGDLNSKLTPVQGIRPKLSHKNSKTKMKEASSDFIPKVPHCSPAESMVAQPANESHDSMSSVQSGSHDDDDDVSISTDSSKEQTESTVPGLNLDPPSYMMTISPENEPSTSFPIIIAETITPIERKQPLGNIPVSIDDPNSLPALPEINFRPATPLPRDNIESEETVSATIGKLLRKTACQAVIRQQELEQLMGDIEEFNEINSSLQSQVNVVEG